MEKVSGIRYVDNEAYLSVLRELVLDGKEVSLMVVGNSMSPFLVHERDMVYLAPVQDPVSVGRIVLFQRDNGAYVLHRVCKVCEDGTFDIVGDAQTMIERGIRRDQIFAEVIRVKRKGRLIGPGSFWWGFFEKVWIRMIPMRVAVLRGYGVLKR